MIAKISEFHTSELKNSIAVFDSGLGGLSVLQDLCQLPELANETFFYFADSKNLPYGDKSAEFIFERILQIAVFLENLGFKALVIACNTATALAADEIRKIVKIPVIAIEPAIKPAVEISKSIGANKIVAVLATKLTIQSQRYQNLIAKYAKTANIKVVSIECSGLAESIEIQNKTQQQGKINELLNKYLNSENFDINFVDAIVLGCTHYIWIKPQISSKLTRSIPILDTGKAVALQLYKKLKEHTKLNTKNTENVDSNQQQCFYFSNISTEKIDELNLVANNLTNSLTNNKKIHFFHENF